MARPILGCCTYCRRELEKPRSRARTALTRDHVMPQCAGGRRKVRCCRQCNSLKGDIHPSAWRWFTANHPDWWRSFRTNAEVVAACRIRFGGKVRVSEIGALRRDDFAGQQKSTLAIEGI